MERNKLYFASDFHLGVPSKASSLEREKRIVAWLDSVKHDAYKIFLVGDVFDFWFEYKHAIPKGFIRLQGKLAELVDSGIKIEMFTGNHDMCMFGYFTEELGIPVHKSPIQFEYLGKKFFVGHGDGLGPDDHGYKFIKRVFANPVSQWLFARLHPNLGISMANYWSRKSRIATGTTDDTYLGDEKEWLVSFCKDELKNNKFDYFIFGHRHLPINMKVEFAQYINLGDWIKYNTYAVFDGKDLQLLKYGV